MSQTERLAYLDRTLQEKGWVTAAEVARRFEVSPRQIKRDIEYLRWRLDAPLKYDGGRHRYYYEKPWAQFRFTDERRVLFSALVQGWAASGSHGALVTPDILEGIQNAVSRDYRAVARRIVFDVPASEPVDLEVFSQVCRALREAVQLDLDYVNLAGGASHRRVEAQRLWNYGGAWYLVAFDHQSSALRTFHLGRVSGLAVTADPVTKPDSTAWNAEVEAWIAAGSGLFRGGETYEATVRLRGQAARRSAHQTWHADQRDEWREGSQTLDRTLPVVDTRELVGRVLAFGGDAEAVSPPEFRRQWVDEVRRIAALLEADD